MKNHTYCLFFFLMLGIASCTPTGTPESQSREKQSGAALSLDQWAYSRSYPEGKIEVKKWTDAFQQMQAEINFRGPDNTENWEELGPKNIGGRTLCLAFHPTDTSVLYVGSAGGGLWKSTTNGRGVNAWERIPIGFPVLSVSAIEINPNNPDIMYIGTGEVYSSFGNTGPGIINRFTRGTYGIGVLKTEDGGQSWTKVLDWSQSQLKGVQDLAMHPTDENTLFVAATDGLYRTTNAGANWVNVHQVPMATDVLIKPDNPSTIFVAHGNLDPNETGTSGIFRSIDGGGSFVELTNGLPPNYSGKTLMDYSISNPDIIYASIQAYFNTAATTPYGLYKTEDAGDSWVKVTDRNVALFQGWYSHDIAVKPDDPNTFIYVGVDAYRSLNGGESLTKESSWNSWFFGQVPVGGPEGPPAYAHADMHRAYFHPNYPNWAYLATDGGIFVSEDVGDTWEGRNGGYQSTQFYANFGNSTTDSLLAIGGMQDNSTAIYIGDDAWVRVLGGDGMSAAIDPVDDNFLYGSSQGLRVSRSSNQGDNFQVIINGASGESVAFNGPFEIAPSDPTIIYAGTQRISKTVNRGDLWDVISPSPVDGPNMIIKIAISPTNPDLIYFATTPDPFQGGTPKIFKSTTSGLTNIEMTGLADRVATDIAFDPTDDNVVYITYSGFNTNHVYKTEDGGISWASIDNGLPDLPTNTIIVDPIIPQNLYIGNDIGVYFSPDSGYSWELYSGELPDAIMVMDLSISQSNRKLRVATHGNGVFQADLRGLPVNTKPGLSKVNIRLEQNYPNPVENTTTIEYELPEAAEVQLQLFAANGQLLRVLVKQQQSKGIHSIETQLNDLPNGVYYYTLSGSMRTSNQNFQQSKILMKQ